MPDPSTPTPVFDPVATAQSFLGTPYVWGGTDKNGVDCSGLVQQTYPKMPRVAHLQKQASTPVTADQLQAGDLAFLHNTQHHPPLPSDYASHVGIYDGKGNIIHASSVHGQVISVPLTNFSSNPNFFGFGRPNGYPTMPKTKSAPVATPKTQAGVQGNLAMQANQGYDTQPQLPLYDPYSPTTKQIGNAPTLDDVMSMMYGGQPNPNTNWSDQQTETIPSLSDQRNTAERNSLTNQVTPWEQKQEQAKSIAALYSAQQKVLAAHPPAQYNVPDLPSMPSRQYADIPTRPAPGFDPMSSSLAALAGIIDPHSAGQYGAMPMQAAIQQANQQYADRQTQYHLTTQQMAQQYEAQMAQYNANVSHSRDVAGANYTNLNATNASQIASENLGAQADAATQQAGDFGKFMTSDNTAAQSALDASQAGRSINDQLNMNASMIGQQNLADNRELNYFKSKAIFDAKTNATTARSGDVDRTNDNKKLIADALNASHEQQTTDRISGMIQSAQIRANAIANKTHGDVSGVPAQYRDQVKRLGQIWYNSDKEASRASMNAEKAFSVNLTNVDHDTFVRNYIAPFNAKSNAAVNNYNNVMDKAMGLAPGTTANATSQATPDAQATGTAAPASPAAPPSLNPAITNIRITPKK